MHFELKPLVGLTPEFFFTLLNTLILFLILKKILFSKVLKIIDDREDEIKKDIQAGEKAKEEGLKFKSEYENKLSSAKNESQEIVDNARRRAEAKSDEIIMSAKQEAENLRIKADNEIKKEKEKAFNEIKREISDVAVMVASKVIEKDIDKEKHEELINEFIKEVGDAK